MRSSYLLGGLGFDALGPMSAGVYSSSELETWKRRIHNGMLALEHNAADHRSVLPARLRTRVAALLSEWRELGLPAPTTASATVGLFGSFIDEHNALEREVDRAIAAAGPPAPAPVPVPSAPPGPGSTAADGPLVDAGRKVGGAVATGIGKGVGQALLLGLLGIGAGAAVVYFVSRRDRD